MKALLILLPALALTFGGCYVRSKRYWRAEEAKMERCRGDWTYMDLDGKKEVTILLFRKKIEFMRIYPAFVIGVTNDHDTIAAIDKDFDTTLRMGQRITISPASWETLEKVELEPVFSVYPRARTNDLHCVVKKVYFSRFEP